jgi:hypothetical protein
MWSGFWEKAGPLPTFFTVYSLTPTAPSLELTVRNSKKFVPVNFDNVVWFSNQELFNKLHASVPLFDGEVPVRSRTPCGRC